MRRALVAVLVLGLAAGLAPAAVGASHDVTIQGVSAGFDPSDLTVALGDDVRWTNADTIGHTSTQSVGVALWNSGTLGGGDAFSVTLTAAGTYPFRARLRRESGGASKWSPAVSITI
jgi:plastocyanin